VPLIDSHGFIFCKVIGVVNQGAGVNVNQGVEADAKEVVGIHWGSHVNQGATV
jgi:hypothetical protein